MQADAFLSEEQGHEASTAQDDQKTLPDLPAEGLKQPDDAPVSSCKLIGLTN